MLRIVLGALAAVLMLGQPTQAAELQVVPIKLGISNVFLLKAVRPVLVDAGAKNDMPALEAALGTQGVKLEELAAVIVTHAHSDHAGLAAEIKRRSGATLVLGEGDVGMAHDGHNDELKPTNLMARILKRFFIDPSYEAFKPDVQVQGEIDLTRFGIAGRAVQMPGHTAGSLVVLLDDGRAFVGDMMLGGWMGGAVFATQAGEHYFQADLARNRANIAALLRLPLHLKTFYLGHGGPVSRASVLSGFDLSEPVALGQAAK